MLYIKVIGAEINSVLLNILSSGIEIITSCAFAIDSTPQKVVIRIKKLIILFILLKLKLFYFDYRVLLFVFEYDQFYRIFFRNLNALSWLGIAVLVIFDIQVVLTFF